MDMIGIAGAIYADLATEMRSVSQKSAGNDAPSLLSTFLGNTDGNVTNNRQGSGVLYCN